MKAETVARHTPTAADLKSVIEQDVAILYSPDWSQSEKSQAALRLRKLCNHHAELVQSLEAAESELRAIAHRPSVEALLDNIERVLAPLDLYLVAASGDGAESRLVSGANLQQALHDALCSGEHAWTDCDLEDVVATVKSIDDDDAWTHDYPDYKRSQWHENYEDGSVRIIRVTETPAIAELVQSLEALLADAKPVLTLTGNQCALCYRCAGLHDEGCSVSAAERVLAAVSPREVSRG
jgi:hypothetical protein